MIRKSNHKIEKLIAAIQEAVVRSQDATDEVDEAAAATLGLNRTDLRCLGALWGGPMAPSVLAATAGLTRGAITTVLDRLEAAGYVRRVRDAADRRGVRVEMTEGARKKAGQVYGPLAEDGRRLLATFSAAELAAVRRFLQESDTLQRTHAERIRGMPRQAALGLGRRPTS